MGHLLAHPRGFLPGLPRTKTAQAGRKFAGWGGPHLTPGITRCSASPRYRADGVSRSDSPSSIETPSPPPSSPASSRKGSKGEEEEGQEQHRSPNPLGVQPSRIVPSGVPQLPSIHPRARPQLVIAPKGRSYSFKRQLAAPYARQVAMPAEGRWVLPWTLYPSLQACLQHLCPPYPAAPAPVKEDGGGRERRL